MKKKNISYRSTSKFTKIYFNLYFIFNYYYYLKNSILSLCSYTFTELDMWWHTKVLKNKKIIETLWLYLYILQSNAILDKKNCMALHYI